MNWHRRRTEMTFNRSCQHAPWVRLKCKAKNNAFKTCFTHRFVASRDCLKERRADDRLIFI